MRMRWNRRAPTLLPQQPRESAQGNEASFWSPRRWPAAERYPRPEIYGGTRRFVFLPRTQRSDNSTCDWLVMTAFSSGGEGFAAGGVRWASLGRKISRENQKRGRGARPRDEV